MVCQKKSPKNSSKRSLKIFIWKVHQKSSSEKFIKKIDQKIRQKVHQKSTSEKFIKNLVKKFIKKFVKKVHQKSSSKRFIWKVHQKSWSKYSSKRSSVCNLLLWLLLVKPETPMLRLNTIPFRAVSSVFAEINKDDSRKSIPMANPILFPSFSAKYGNFDFPRNSLIRVKKT